MNALRPVIALVFVCLLLPAAASAQPRFGAWTPGSPNGGHLATTNALEQQVHRRVSIVHWFVDWAHGSLTEDGSKAIRAVIRSHRTPLLTWMPADAWRGITSAQPDYSLASIVRGDHDGQIRNWGRMIARFKKPVYVRLMHEMNGDWNPWGGTVNGNSSAQFRAAWRHVVDLARASGARNARWVFSPLAEDVPRVSANRFEKYYPGRRYVDVLGISGYNWGGDSPWYGGWRTFNKIFRKPYKRIRRLGPQPVWLTEVGCASNGGNKSAWVKRMWRQSSRWKRVKAIVWYNEDKEKDWSVANAASAFRP